MKTLKLTGRMITIDITGEAGPWVTITEENVFDWAEACHAWLSLNHEGQWSETYRLLGRSQFQPGPLWSESAVEEENPWFPDVSRENIGEIMAAIEAVLEGKQ